jgi:hypothetical protein
LFEIFNDLILAHRCRRGPSTPTTPGATVDRRRLVASSIRPLPARDQIKLVTAGLICLNLAGNERHKFCRRERLAARRIGSRAEAAILVTAALPNLPAIGHPETPRET